MIQASAYRIPASRGGFIDRHGHKSVQVLGHKGLQFDVYFSLKTFFSQLGCETGSMLEVLLQSQIVPLVLFIWKGHSEGGID